MATTEEPQILELLLRQWDWAIDAYRGYLNASFPRNKALTLCAIVFLTMSEVTRLHFARYPLEGLQADAGDIRYTIFKAMSVIPVLGVVAIRVIEIFTVSHSIILTVCIAVISAMSAEVPPSVMTFYRRVKSWVGRWRQEEVDVERGPEQMVARDDGRLASIQARLPYIYDTMQSVCGVASVVVVNFLGLLEQSVRAARHRLRSGDSDSARERNDLEDIASIF